MSTVVAEADNHVGEKGGQCKCIGCTATMQVDWMPESASTSSSLTWGVFVKEDVSTTLGSEKTC